jgi:hypothetical protein
MKYRIEIERSAQAILEIEADDPDQAARQAFSQVREEDFGHGNLSLVYLEPIVEG